MLGQKEIQEEAEGKCDIDVLFEHLIGMTPDDPNFLNRLEEDRDAIRTKYFLPGYKYSFSNPGLYYRELELLVMKEGIQLRSLYDTGSLLDDFGSVGGLYRDGEVFL